MDLRDEILKVLAAEFKLGRRLNLLYWRQIMILSLCDDKYYECHTCKPHFYQLEDPNLLNKLRSVIRKALTLIK